MKNKIVFLSRKFLDEIEFFGFSYLLLFWLSYCIEWELGLNTNSSKQLLLVLLYTKVKTNLKSIMAQSFLTFQHRRHFIDKL